MTAIPRGQTPERRAYMKLWNSLNPRDRHIYKSVYDVNHRAENALYRVANSEHRKQQNAAWYAANRASILKRVKSYAEANKERILGYQATYYAENSERVKSNVAAYRRAFPEKKAHLENRRRARKAGNGGTHTLEERLAKFARLGNVCFYCGQPKKLTVDHDLPLTRGGTDNIENILPACRSCNSKKKTLTALEFIAKLGGMSDLK